MSNPVDRLANALSDRYTIDRELGAGGMATVYLAEDVKHNRKVAVKVLRPELAAVLGAERFLQEIKTTANLQHPHILPLHDSGEADGLLFYVMPFVEGESLRDRLDREKQLSIEDSLEIAQAVAGALDSAHRHNVIHRDIKPENILLHDGQPVVADFGIALAVSQAGGARMTETGLSLGTPHYMSPEQAMGDREIDARSDQYALACVLYEMLAGEPPYTGPSAQAIVAKVITEKATPVTVHRDTVPPHVSASIQKCLSKLPADRFATASQFAQALSTPGSGPATVPVATPGVRPAATARDWRLPAALASAVVFAGLFLFAALRGPEPPEPEPVARFTLSLPNELGSSDGRLITISPDGTRIVYVGQSERGTQLFSRRLGDAGVEPIPDTEGGSQPFFSPDGRWIGFVVGSDVIRRVPSSGGPALDVLRFVASGISGPHWGDDGTIIFSQAGSLYRVGSTGGVAERIGLEASRLVYWPELLPGGDAALVTLGQLSTTASVGVVDLATGSLTILLAEGGQAHYLPNGFLVYGHRSGAVLAVGFDPRSRTITTDPRPVLDLVSMGGGTSGGLVQFAVSGNGTAVYLEGGTVGGNTKIVLSDLEGQEVILPVETGGSPRFSPSGGRLAFVANNDVYVHELAVGATSRVTFEGLNVFPTWSPDGQYIAFASLRGGSDDFDVHRRRSDGRGDAERLTSKRYSQGPRVWLSDGRLLVIEVHPEGQYDLHVLDSTGTMTPYLTNAWNESAPSVSPDERWVAYVSDETGQNEVYVSAFPEAGGRWQISQDGGSDPFWTDDRVIYFLHDGELYAAEVRTSPSVSVVHRTLVLTGPYVSGERFSNVHRAPGGGRFALVRSTTEGAVREMTVVVNWYEELEERVGR
jgi:serine/threonine-protein kinase